MYIIDPVKVDRFMPVIDDMSADDLREAVVLMTGYATRQATYTDRNYQNYFDETRLIPHPFKQMPEDRTVFDDIYFIGALGVTASIGAFLYTACLCTTRKEIGEFAIYFCQAENMPEGNFDIFAEFTSLGTTYLCSGMTNYSGEGGAGSRELIKVSNLLAFANGAIMNHVYLPALDHYSVVSDAIEKGLRIEGIIV